jgi:hypothetical protein
VLPLALCVLAARAKADDGWRRVGVEGGIVVEAREVPGSSLHEVRATVHADAPPAALLGVLWRHEEQPQFMPHLRHVEVVRDGADERVVYEQLDIPLLKDRDVVLHVRRTVDATTGTIDVTSAAVSDEGPPETSRFVRVKTSAGHWHLVPAAGGTDLTYTIRTDVGLPAWLVNRAQHETVPDVVHAVIERARRAVPPSP